MKTALTATMMAFLIIPTAFAQSSHLKLGDCTCRFQGADFQEGQMVCARISGKEVTLQCDRVLNNTSWKTIQDGCDQQNLS
ncbi:MAG: hypothetical protein AAF940_14710 [Pseudomonadota bacterium]